MSRILLFLMLLTSCCAATHNEVVAAVIIAEAGGEGELGIRAVASVIENRTRYNKDAFVVVTQKFQFSCLNGVSQDKLVAKARMHSRWQYAVKLTKEIYNHTLVDVTDGATHYLNPKKLDRLPSWVSKMRFTKKIGAHYFYRET